VQGDNYLAFSWQLQTLYLKSKVIKYVLASILLLKADTGMTVAMDMIYLTGYTSRLGPDAEARQ